MKIYIDPRLIGRANFESLVKRYPQIDFVTEVDDKTEIEVLISMPPIVKSMDLDEYPKLRWIQYLMAGYDGLDLTRFTKRGIVFCNAQDIFSKSIAEDVFTKILFFNRNVKHYLESMKDARWEPIREELELTGSTVLILGVGSIGKELARRFQAFDANVIGYRSRPLPEVDFDAIITTPQELDSALSQADYVILALPLTAETEKMFDAEKFGMMKKEALFINVARGKIVDQEALIETLKNKRIRGAGLDVMDPEPLPADNPLWKLENVYITPHNASSSPFMRDRLYQMVLMNLDLYLAGKPVRYRVDS